MSQRKPKRYYDTVAMKRAENSTNRNQETVRGVIYQNKRSQQQSPSQQNDATQSNDSKTNSKSNSDQQSIKKTSEVRSVGNNVREYQDNGLNDSYDDDGHDSLADYKRFPSCYNRKKIVVAPINKNNESSQPNGENDEQ